MTHRLLAAATLMLVTTATAWAETEGVPNVKTPEPEKVETQMEETLTISRVIPWNRRTRPCAWRVTPSMT